MSEILACRHCRAVVDDIALHTNWHIEQTNELKQLAESLKELGDVTWPQTNN